MAAPASANLPITDDLLARFASTVGGGDSNGELDNLTAALFPTSAIDADVILAAADATAEKWNFR